MSFPGFDGRDNNISTRRPAHGGFIMDFKIIRKLRRALFYLVVAGFCFFSAAPFVWMLITMFKQDKDLYQTANNPFLFNDPPTLDNINFLRSEEHTSELQSRLHLVCR